MNELDNEIIVLDIAGKYARLKVKNIKHVNALLLLGFKAEEEQLVRLIADDADRHLLVIKLIDMDALFSAGKDWSPEEFLGYLYEQGVIQKKYKVIAWRNPNDYFISVKN